MSLDERVRKELESKNVLCKEHYEKCLKFWNEDISMAIYPIQEEVLNRVWNNVEKEVQCILLNNYYSTNLKEGLYRKGNETEENHPIVTDKINDDFIKQVKEVKKESPEVVDLVKKLSPVYSKRAKKHEKTITCFASKFCSRYNPKAFPIYDDLVRRMLYLINQNPEYRFSKEDISLGSLKNYENYKKAVDCFIERYKKELPEMKTYKDFDRYIWSWAKKIKKRDVEV